MIRICFVSVSLLACFGSLVEAAPTVNPSKGPPPASVLKFMQRFGYLEQGTPDSAALYSEEAFSEAIRIVQKFGAITETGVLDNATLKLMQSDRCGVPDVVRHHSEERRRKRFIIGSEGWKKRDITYFVANWSPKVGEEAIVDEVERAFEAWSGYARLSFRHVRDPNADIVIAFGRGPHGDPYPFDGPGSILAHAYFPYEMDSYGGDIHFDDDEDWKIRPGEFEDGVDFFTVAVHELGHSLGLAHSPVPSSIMFPYYKGYQPNFQLDYDDILAMYDLYIAKKLEGDDDPNTIPGGERSGEDLPDGRTDEDSEPDERHDEDNEPDDRHDEDSQSDDRRDEDSQSDDRHDEDSESDGRRDEDSQPDDRHDEDSQPDDRHDEDRRDYDQPESSDTDVTPTSSVPSPTTETSIIYEGDDETVDDHLTHDDKHRRPTEPTRRVDDDACEGSYDAIAVLRGELFVFKNKFVWRLSQRGIVQPGYPVPFRQMFWKLPEIITKIDAVFERESDGSIVLFTGDTYWIFNGNNFIEGSPRPLTDYGLPPNLASIDAAFVWKKNGKIYFFSGDQYWRYNETIKKMDSGYPLDITRWRGIPRDLNAAMTWTDGLTYFFKDKLFWRFDNILIKTDDRYPLPAPQNWLGCPEQQDTIWW